MRAVPRRRLLSALGADMREPTPGQGGTGVGKRDGTAPATGQTCSLPVVLGGQSGCRSCSFDRNPGHAVTECPTGAVTRRGGDRGGGLRRRGSGGAPPAPLSSGAPPMRLGWGEGARQPSSPRQGARTRGPSNRTTIGSVGCSGNLGGSTTGTLVASARNSGSGKWRPEEWRVRHWPGVLSPVPRVP